MVSSYKAKFLKKIRDLEPDAGSVEGEPLEDAEKTQEEAPAGEVAAAEEKPAEEDDALTADDDITLESSAKEKAQDEVS